MKSKLAELQILLYRLITAPGGPHEAALQQQVLLENGACEGVIRGNNRLSAIDRVGIYANAYFYRLHDILKEDFAYTHTILGDVNFHNLVTGYLIEYPPNEPSVFYAGQHFPRYLRKTTSLPGVSLSQWPFLADLAEFERAFIEAFHGPDAPVLAVTSLRDLPAESWPSLKIRLHPAAQILEPAWRIDTVVEAIKAGQQWHPPQRSQDAILVWRQDWQVRYRALAAGEGAALKTAVSLSDFASICDALAKELQTAGQAADLAAIIHRMLTRWIGDGLLIGT